EDGIRDFHVTGVQTCALPIYLQKHRAALSAADAFSGDSALEPKPVHGVDEMQHDAVAARAYRMTKTDCSSIDVEALAVERTKRKIGRASLGKERRDGSMGNHR